MQYLVIRAGVVINRTVGEPPASLISRMSPGAVIEPATGAAAAVGIGWRRVDGVWTHPSTQAGE